MKYNNKSDYAINKKTKDIVYRFIDGTETRTRKVNGKVYQVTDSTDTIELSPQEMSTKEFDRMKTISNVDYHKREKHGKRVTRDDVPIHNLLETNCVSDRSAEQEYIDYLDALEAPPETRTMENALAILDKCLTEIQKRRFIAYHFMEKTEREVAREEGVDCMAVHRSLMYANKKINKFLRKP